jgi:hypothetical protein
MTALLNNLPTWLVALIIIGGCTGVAVGVLLVLRDTVKSSVVEQHNDVAGYVFAVVGVLYALLLGFIIFATWEHVSTAEADVQHEAASLTALYHTSAGLPNGVRQQAQSELRRYTSLVISDGWPALAQGEPSPRVDASLGRLYQIYATGNRTGVPANVDSESLQLLNDVSATRAERLAGAHGFLSGILWGVVIFGGVCTLAFALLFYLENTGIQIAMMAILAALIASMLFLLVVLDHPYSGGYTVSPEPFQMALEQMRIAP